MPDGFSNAIIGGAEILIRSAIKSQNYVAGTAGWRIAKDGTAEFNNVTVRGNFTAGGGNVSLSASGLHIVGVNQQYDINGAAGFLARKNPDNGSFAQMEVGTNGTSDGGIVGLQPQSPTPNAHTIANGYVFAGYSTAGINDSPYLDLFGPAITGKANARILMGGQTSGSASDDSVTTITSNQIVLGGNGNVVTNRPRWIVDFGTPSIANNTVQALTPASVLINTGGIGSGSTVTIPTTDVWQVGFSLRFATNATGNRMARLFLNGGEYTSFVIPAISGFNTTAFLSLTALFQAGDQLVFNGYQNSGAALSLTGVGNCGWVIKELA